MNPTVDNDLQKAIDDITKNTSVDPVFSDPVAAPSSIPEGGPGVITEPMPISDIKPVGMPKMPTPRPTMPAPMPPIAEAPKAPVAEPAPVVEPIATPEPTVSSAANVSGDMKSVKEAALRDLAPLLGKIDMDSSKKFKLYKDIREELHDDSIIGDAYETAKNISDDTERGEALLYLVESIDNM